MQCTECGKEGGDEK